jgi:uncharacterized short protein YbdD (DUF466 family)
MGGGGLMETFFERMQSCLQYFWAGLRQWSGDAAYERYVECTEKRGTKVALSETEFYVEQLNRKYSRPNRCC